MLDDINHPEANTLHALRSGRSDPQLSTLNH